MTDERDRRDAALWRQHRGRTTAADQPRLYRVRLFEGPYEVLSGALYPVVLDLTPGPALEESHHRLDELLRSLLRIANVKPAKVRLHSLDIGDWDSGISLFKWPVTWDPEP